MRMRLAAATFLVFGAGSAAIGAATIDMRGSDTLLLITRDVINACPAIAPDVINYVGGGSGGAETFQANNPPTQSTGSMSRFLQAGPVGNLGAAKACDTDSGTGVKAEGLAFALDGVGIVANTTNSNACGGVSFNRGFTVTDENGGGIDCLTTSCPGGVYAPGTSPVAAGIEAHEPWGDFIRLAFFGIHHSSTVVGGVRDCNSDARRSLVKNYTNLFQTACTGGGCAGKPLRHLFRRDDISGTTEVFAQLLGTAFSRFCNVGNTIPGTTTAGFSDFLDKDPIRVPCPGNGGNAGDQVCGSAVPTADTTYDATKNTPSPAGDGETIGANAGSLGLVQVVFVPESKDIPVATEMYATVNCDGESTLLEATKTTFSGTCPSGSPSFGGQCFTSVIRTIPAPAPVEGGFNANCIQRFTSTACPFLTPTGIDCRGANLWLRRPNGTLVVDTSLTVAGRKYAHAAYRIHQTKAIAGTSFCRNNGSTEQIGCLVGDADQCSGGFAGRSAFDPAGSATGLLVNNIPPDVASIRNLVTDPANKYPIARKLYFNSINGFNNATRPELELAKCFVNDTIMGTTTTSGLVTVDGFITLPDRAGKPRQLCQDFKEQNATTVPQPETGCGFGAGVNACSDNAAIGLPVD